MKIIRSIEPIAVIRTDFKEKFGVPRQSGRVKSAVGRIIFEEEYRNSEALRGIEDYSYLWLIFDFSQAHRDKWSPTVRPPRLGGNRRVGVFATRSPFRPNSLGLSSVRLEGLEKTADGTTLLVSGADLVDNTPIYDIKPYIPYADCHTDARGGFSEEAESHHLNVTVPLGALDAVPEGKRQAIIECIADDPRPSYQDDPGRVYTMRFSDFDVSFKIDKDCAEITGVKTVK